MRNIKLILPMLAFVLAIGMSFATVKLADPNLDYLEDGTPIPETECVPGITFECRAQLEENGTTYQIYDDPELQIPKTGAVEDVVIKLWE